MHCFKIYRFDQKGTEEIPATILAPNAEIASAATWMLQTDLAAQPCERNLPLYGSAFWGVPLRFFEAVGFDPTEHQGRTKLAQERRQAAQWTAYHVWARANHAAIADALESIEIGTTSRTDRRALDELRERMEPDELADFLATRDEEFFDHLRYRRAAQEKAARIRDHHGRATPCTSSPT